MEIVERKKRWWASPHALACAVICGVLHFLLVLSVVRAALVGTDQAWPLMWVSFVFFDFPMGLLMILMPHLPKVTLVPGVVGHPLNDTSNFWVPVILFGLGGTVWWSLIGAGIGWAIRDALLRRKSNTSG